MYVVGYIEIDVDHFMLVVRMMYERMLGCMWWPSYYPAISPCSKTGTILLQIATKDEGEKEDGEWSTLVFEKIRHDTPGFREEEFKYRRYEYD